ncbi:hypothetical protein B0I35DRAFT_351300 [Stachybotrys elegans]|uniref:Peptidase M20 domain-containing protein 2 n=1 Tax=Stachybotrys elegans TaxID=80388 RepID=A0A8K0STI3_9HYPO|nr:hypothetical protein B0I35DRAFT_351300 [Stachybotrys elegans]
MRKRTLPIDESNCQATRSVDEDDYVVVSFEHQHQLRRHLADHGPNTTPTSVSSAASGDEDEEPRYLAEISRIVDKLNQEFWPVNKKIHDNPEQGFQEYIAHEALTNFMESRAGWKVTRSAYGMDTAWVAVYDSGKVGPVISYNAEMDCLPGIGQACGHNLIASASVVGAVATAEIMKKHSLPGKIVLFGTPAEEGGGGKIKLLDAGAYSDYKCDVNLITHPGAVDDSALMRTTAYSGFKVEYFGREAHAAANPWLGINALDALITAYNSFSMLRQQCMAGDIIQGRITDGGIAPNIIHAYAAGHFVARAPTQARLLELKKKVDACFEAGALATGAKLKMTPLMNYKDHVPNQVMAKSYTRYFNRLNPPHLINPARDLLQGTTQASTDQGDVSYAMPSLSVGFSIDPGPTKQGPHNPEFAKAAGTKDAFDRACRAGKGLAGVALDLLCVEGMLDEVKKSWKESLTKY